MANRRFMLFLLSIFISTIILIVFLQYNSDDHINKLIQGNESLISEFGIIGETQKLQADMLYIESDIHRAVINKDSSFLHAIQDREKNVRSTMFKLKQVPASNINKALIQQLDSLVEEKLKFGNNVIYALFMKGQPAAEEMYRGQAGKSTMGEIANVIDQVNGPRRAYLTRLATDVDKSGYRARQLGIFLAIIATLVSILTFWYISKRIRQQQQLFNQLNESEKKVREAGIIKENFMANMSHEIRTPMNAILGFTNLLQKEPLNQKSREFVNSIQTSSENLLTIINEVLDFSKIEAGMMRIESNPFSLRGLLHSVETMFASRVQSKNLQLTVAVDESIPDVLEGDAVRLTQIMVNLVNNSVKFTNAGGISINVTPGSGTGDQLEISFSIKDTGIGIPPGKINTIFERFQQGDEETTRKYGGTGLGLAIVKQLVELQNGKITVSSEQYTGSEFVFTIPYTISKEVAEKAGHTFTEPHQTQLNEKNIRILVAEDNAMNQNLMRHLLAGWHLDFDIVNNGEEVIDMLHKHKYNLVLMDIQMPQMDGYTATMKIRNELKSNIPIVAMTAHAMAGEREKCLSYGMNEYIPKPIRENELFKIINDILKPGSGATGIINEGANCNQLADEVLNLAYLRELSGGSTQFEINMVEQFLQQVPLEVKRLTEAFDRKNYREIARIAHNLRTSVSFMGLSERLDSHLDYIENNAGVQTENSTLQHEIRTVSEICSQAFSEAKKYLDQIT